MKKKLSILCVGLLTAGSLGIISSTHPVLAFASSTLVAKEMKPTLSQIRFIGGDLGFGEIKSDYQGNLVTTRYTDEQTIYLQPVYKIDNLASQENLTVRVSIKNAKGTNVYRIPLKKNAHESNFYNQKSSTALSNPGKKRTEVLYELFSGKVSIGSFKINFAPAAEQPENFNPIIAPEGKLLAPKNVRIEQGFLKWNKVFKAERYKIIVYSYDQNGKIIKGQATVDSDNISQTRESIAEIKSFLQLPAGHYKFSVKASSLHQGFWNETRASDESEKTTLVEIK